MWMMVSPGDSSRPAKRLPIITVLVRILETMLVVGTIGSIVVLVLSGIEDLKLLLGREEQNYS